MQQPPPPLLSLYRLKAAAAAVEAQGGLRTERGWFWGETKCQIQGVHAGIGGAGEELGQGTFPGRKRGWSCISFTRETL